MSRRPRFALALPTVSHYAPAMSTHAPGSVNTLPHGERTRRARAALTTVVATLVAATSLAGCECTDSHLAGLYLYVTMNLGGGNYHFEFEVPGQVVTMDLVGTVVSGCTPSCTGTSGTLHWQVGVEGYASVTAMFEDVVAGGGPATLQARATKNGRSVLDQTMTPTYFPAGCRDEQRRAELYATIE